jgi:hypothetical protein
LIRFRFRVDSHQCPDSEVRIIFAARSVANFGIEGHWQLYDSSAALNPKFAIGLAAIVVRTSGSRHWPGAWVGARSQAVTFPFDESGKFRTLAVFR